MVHRNLKLGVFVLEGLNAFATSYYFNYLFFLLEAKFGFTNFERLAFSAANGFIYMAIAWYGGRFGQRRGYFAALNLGFAIMGLSLVAGLFLPNTPGQIAVMVIWTLGMCFTWPNLEALASESEDRPGVKQMIGIYNVVWASAAALAFFCGGAMIERLGWASMFWLPALMHFTQLALIARLRRQAAQLGVAAAPLPALNTGTTAADAEHIAASTAKAFQRMAWLANPFAYIAINTAIPLIPEVAKRLDLTTMYAGFFCSVWMFARLGTFLLLWLWPRWHYRFSWLISSYAVLVASFVAMLLVPRFWMVLLAQVVFGWAIGLLYYSSLFYSMDRSDTKGEHGGMHESALGFGIFAGPAVGALAVRLFPHQPAASTWSVSAVLLLGMGGLFWLWWRPKRKG